MSAPTAVDQARRVNLNSVWLLLARISGQALMFLLSVAVARQLGDSGLGQYAFIGAVLFVGNVLATFGLDTLLIRDIADRGSAQTPLMAASFYLQLGISILFIAAVMAGSSILPNQTAETLPALRLASLSLIPLSLLTVYSSALRAYQRMEFHLLANLISSVTQVMTGLLLLNKGFGLMSLAWAILLGHLAGAAAAAALCWYMLPGFGHSWKTSRSNLRSAVVMAWRLAVLMVLAVVYQRLGVLTLSLLGGDAAAGWFSAASRLVEAAKMVPYSLFGALFPVMVSRASAISKPGIGGARTRPWHLPAYAAGCVSVLTISADWLIPRLYGPGYGPAIGAIRILVWSLVPFVIALRLSFELISSGRDGAVLKATCLTTLLTLLACVLVVPSWGLNGACWAMLSGEIIHAASLAAWRRGARMNMSYLGNGRGLWRRAEK